MRMIVMIIFLVLLGLLAILNRHFLTYPHTLNLGFAEYKDMPVGLMLLAASLIPMLVFYFWASVTKLRAQADTAKLLRDMESLRTSLDSQEGSRFQQLQATWIVSLPRCRPRPCPAAAAPVRSLPWPRKWTR